MKLLALLLILSAAQVDARARDLGVPFEGKPGPLNAITDIPGVEVGQVTLIKGDGALQVGVGPIRNGVTVIFPRGKADRRLKQIEAGNAFPLRTLVKLGLGIALVVGKPGRHSQGLHERAMSREFGRSRIHLVRRRGVSRHPAVSALADAVRKEMNH